MTRREALAGFAQFLAASPLLADRKYSELSDPIYSVANVFDMAKLAKKKLDPLAWDYIDEGSEDEISLRDNRAGFERLIIRPHFLQNDVSKIDTSTSCSGRNSPTRSSSVQRAARTVSSPMASRRRPMARGFRTR